MFLKIGDSHRRDDFKHFTDEGFNKLGHNWECYLFQLDTGKTKKVVRLNENPCIFGTYDSQTFVPRETEYWWDGRPADGIPVQLHPTSVDGQSTCSTALEICASRSHMSPCLGRNKDGLIKLTYIIQTGFTHPKVHRNPKPHQCNVPEARDSPILVTVTKKSW